MSNVPDDRLWPYIKEDGRTKCWLWMGRRNTLGYGHIAIESKKSAMVHRVVYEKLVGPIPEGLVIDHLCRVTSCCNPAHLEPVTQRINTLRGLSEAAKNAKKTHCKWGHPLSGDNLGSAKKKYGYIRVCRRCKADDALKTYHLTKKLVGNRMPKLTAAQANQIRLSSEPAKDLSKRFGVVPSLIYKIKTGKAWRQSK